MIGLLLTVVAGVTAFAAAAWLHELTHAAAVQALGGRVVAFNASELYVDYTFGEPAPRRERLVLLAPGLVGLALTPGLAYLWLEHGLTAGTAIATVAWAIYTLTGGTEGELTLASETLSRQRSESTEID